MTTIQITQNLPRLCGLLFSMVIIGVSLEAKADEIFKMQTHPKEVPGTWEIIHS